MKKYIVELTSEERSALEDIVKAERMAAHKRRHARMLLKADQGPLGDPRGKMQTSPMPLTVRPRALSVFVSGWSNTVSISQWITATVVHIVQKSWMALLRRI